ncbi:MAG: HAMP domain-containing protein, partial [Eubacteriales bacterium]
MKKIKKMSFTYKLLVVFILVALVPVLIIMMLFYQMMANILQDKTNDYLRNISNVTISKLEDSIIYVEDTGFFVAGNEEIQDMLILEKNATLNQIEKYKQYQAIKQALAIHSVVKQEIISMFIESSKGSRYNYSKGNSYFDFSKLEMENTFESGKWSVIDSKIYYYKSIHTYLEEGCLGKLAIEVEPMVFYEIIKDIDYSSSGEVYLINNDGIIIASKDAKATGQELESVYKNLEIKSDVIYPNVMIEESSYTVYVSEEISNGWSLLLSIPTKYYINDIIRVQQQTIIMLICSSIIIVLLIIYTANQVTRPIKKLSQAMMEIGQGNLDVSCTVETEDEIGILSQSFNQMVEDMKHLIQSEFEQKVMSQGAEMKSLQMQINPHFLYNTLDTINWMARMQGLDEVGDITSS